MRATTDSEMFLSGPKVAARYGVTAQTLWRWSCNEALAFPRPLIVNRRRLFKIADLEAWEATRKRPDPMPVALFESAA